MPLFSVIIPSYNRFNLIMNAVNSVLKQSVSDFELIIVDDGSTDATGEHFSQLQIEKLHYFSQANKGVSAARNRGASESIGDYLIFLDSDDVLTSNCLLAYKERIDQTGCELIFSDMNIVNAVNGKEQFISARNPYGNVPSSGIYIPGTFCISRNLFFACGGYDEQMAYGENTELKFRINKRNPDFTFTDSVGLLYYQSLSGGSKNLQNIISSNRHMIRKHNDIFKSRPLLMMKYRRAIAVAQFRIGKYSEARKEMWRACMAYPYQVKNYFRLLMYFIPFITKKII